MLSVFNKIRLKSSLLLKYISGAASSSLLYQYIYYASIIIIFTVVTCCLITLSENNSHEEEYNMLLYKDGVRLGVTFDESMQFTENIASILSFEFIKNDYFSTEHINFLVEHQRENFLNDVLNWNIFHYVTPKGNMILNNSDGTRTYINMHDYQREWLYTAKNNPFSLQFSKPGLGSITQNLTLSAGYGFVDHNNFFRGYIAADIDIPRLVMMLKKSIPDDVSFILLDNNMNIVLSSERALHNLHLPMMQLSKLSHRNPDNSSILSSPININGYFFNCAISSETYPFTFLVGQSNQIYKNKIQQHVIPQTLRNMSMGIVFASILLFVGYQALYPILDLSRIADNISHGKSMTIPSYSSHELNTLAKQLNTISKYTKDLKHQQIKLTKANQDLHNANEFIQSNMSFLSHELKNPVSSILGFAKILQDKIELIGNNHDKDCIDLVYNAALHQEKQIDFFLKLFKFQGYGKTIESAPINLRETIFSNVNMVRHHAIKNRVSIEVSIDDDLPMMLGDEIMIGQVIQNFAANGAKYSKRGGHLLINAFIRSNNKGKRELVIEFKDNGIGIRQQDLQKIFKKFKRIENEKTSSVFGYGIGLNYAKSCVMAHDGVVQVKSKIDVGTSFTVIFPSYRILEN